MAEDNKKDTRVFMVNQSFVDPDTDSNTQLSLAKYEFILLCNWARFRFGVRAWRYSVVFKWDRRLNKLDR